MSKRYNMQQAKQPLEATYSVDEVATYFGCHVSQVHKLIALGRTFRAKLHPTRGGLWPTFRISHKCRRIPQSAIDRHLRHMDRSGADLKEASG